MSNKVDAAQVTKAVAALRKHAEKVKAEGGTSSSTATTTTTPRPTA